MLTQYALAWSMPSKYERHFDASIASYFFLRKQNQSLVCVYVSVGTSSVVCLIRRQRRMRYVYIPSFFMRLIALFSKQTHVRLSELTLCLSMYVHVNCDDEQVCDG